MVGQLIRMVWVAGALVITLGACASKKPALDSDEVRARKYVEIASGSFSEGDNAGAFRALNEAEKIDPKLPEIHHIRGIILISRGELAQAKLSVERAIQLKPEYSAARNTLGKILLNDGKFMEAEIQLRLAADDRTFSEGYMAHTNLGILYYKTKKFTKAMVALSQAINDRPNMGCVARYYRGHVHLREGRIGDAIRDYDAATKRFCANFAEAYYALGVAQIRGKKFDSARKTLLDVVSRYQDKPIAKMAIDQLRYIP